MCCIENLLRIGAGFKSTFFDSVSSFTVPTLSQVDIKEEDSCVGSACYPSTGDLLVGRGDKLYASSTCGTDGRAESFCVISDLQGRGSCSYWCDSRPTSGDTYSHLPKYMEITFRGKKSWWQSENGKEKVYLQVSTILVRTH